MATYSVNVFLYDDVEVQPIARVVTHLDPKNPHATLEVARVAFFTHDPADLHKIAEAANAAAAGLQDALDEAARAELHDSMRDAGVTL